ncbi:MAG: hypothetical protein ACFFCP_09965, partial [Promethearchaeota archaeon]
NTESPVASIGMYLYYIHLESRERGYNFQFSKIDTIEDVPKIRISNNLLLSEFQHLLSKLKERDKEKYRLNLTIEKIEPHPSFKAV